MFVHQQRLPESPTLATKDGQPAAGRMASNLSGLATAFPILVPEGHQKHKKWIVNRNQERAQRLKRDKMKV